MKQLTAKFKCNFVTIFGKTSQNVTLSPVTNDGHENKSYSIYTPAGKLEMSITNPAAMGFFEPDDFEYEILITKVPKAK